MTAPLLATRDALTEALRKHTLLGDVCRCGWDGEEHSEIHAEHVADALSGILRDPATLADELCKRLCDLAGEPRLFIPGEIRAVLASALTEDPRG